MNAARPKSIEEAFVHIDYVRASQADIMRALEDIKDQLQILPDLHRRVTDLEASAKKNTLASWIDSLFTWVVRVSVVSGAVAGLVLGVREFVHWTDRVPSHDAQKQAAPK